MNSRLRWTDFAAQDTLSEHFKSMRFRTSETPEGLEVKAGSDAMFRLLGFLGTNSIPVGLTIKLEEENGRTTVKATAFDRLGWYINDRGVFGTQEALEQRAGVPSRRGSFSPRRGSPSNPG